MHCLHCFLHDEDVKPAEEWEAIYVEHKNKECCEGSSAEILVCPGCFKSNKNNMTELIDIVNYHILYKINHMILTSLCRYLISSCKYLNNHQWDDISEFVVE